MKITETKVFKFEELNDKAKAVAIAKHLENYDIEQECFNDDAALQISDAGFEDAVLSYSLSNSQGDGLSFSAKRYNKLAELFAEVLGKGKEKTAKLLADNMAQKFKGNNGHYCYASASDVDMHLETWTSSINVTNTDHIDEVVAKVLSKLQDLYVKLCKKLEKKGYADFEGQCTAEYIVDEITSNEFTEDGKRFDH